MTLPKKKYVYAQNNIFLHELTVQEQGVEEFDMLKNELYISDSLENLNNKIDGLYGYVKEYSDDKRARLERESDAEKARLERESDKKEDRKFNILGVFLALMFIIEPFAMTVKNAIFWDTDFFTGLIWFIVSLVVIFIINKRFKLFSLSKLFSSRRHA